MEKINLRKYYPSYYKQDYFVEVTDDIFEAMQKAERQEAAYSRRIRKYKAYYYFTENNYIEYSALSLKPIKTPYEMCETSALRTALQCLKQPACRENSLGGFMPGIFWICV